jgi:hypothetical protein
MLPSGRRFAADVPGPPSRSIGSSRASIAKGGPQCSFTANPGAAENGRAASTS